MPSRSRRGGRKGKASHPATTTSNTAATTHHHAEVVLPPKLNLTNIHAIARKNNSNDDEEEMRSAKNAAPAFFYTPPQQQQQEKEHQARQSVSSQAEQSVADDAAQKERGNAPDPSASSALVHLTSTSDAHILATDKNTGMTTYSNSIENTVNKEHAAPALRHTGPVVTEAWSRSVVHPGDEYLLYQSIEANTLSSSSASAPRSARRTMNTNSSSHNAYYGNTPQRANSLTSNHSPLSLLHERAPRQRQASVQLAQQRQAQLQLQQQRTVRITRLAPQPKTRANPSQANPSGSVPLPPSSASFSRDVSLGSNAQEAPRHGSLTRLVQSATRRRAESMDYATLGQSLARSTSYLRAPSECSLQQQQPQSQIVNNPSAATVGAMDACGSVPRGALYSRDNTQVGRRGGVMNDGLVDAQFSFTAIENSNDLTTACVKNAEPFAARDEEETAVLSRGETSPVVRANARQARARNAALFFTRPSFYLTEESSTKTYNNYNNTSSVTFAESDGSMADVQQQQQRQQPGYQNISTTQLSAATSTPQSTQYTRSANYVRYDRSNINNSDRLRHGVGRDGEVDEMALMMRRRAELLAQLAPHTKAQDEAAMKEASTKTHTSTNTSTNASSLYVLPSSLRVRPSMSAAAVPRPTSRLRRLPNIALASIAELQPSNTCTNATTKDSDNTTATRTRSEISKECAALEPVSLQALLMPATNTDEALTPNAKARLQLSQDAATVRLLCDPFFPLVSEENYQRLQMCEAEHTARQALALWRNTITCTAAENGAAGENSNNSPMPELPLTAIALDFSEHAEGREKREEESSTKKSTIRAMKKAQDGTHQGETSGEHEATAGEASQKATEQHTNTSTSSKASKPQPPYVAPRPIHLSRRVRRRQQQQQEARRNAAQGTHESTAKESVEKKKEVVAAAVAQATTDTARGKQQEEEAAASEPAVQPVQVEASHNALTLSPTHSPSSSPSRSHTRMTSPNRLLVNAVMPSERTGVVQPLITSVLGFHRSMNTNSAMSSITSPPAASAAAASTSVTGVLRHSPPKGTAPRSPSPHDEHEKEEKEKKKEEEEKKGTAADTPQRLAAEAAKAEEDAAALLAQTSTSADGHLTAADEVNNKKEEVPALVPCEAAKLNADTARVIGELKDVSAAAAAVTIEKSPEKVAEQLLLVAPVPLIAYTTGKTPYGDELRAYMRHALHQVVHTMASSTGHSEVCHGTNDDDEKVLLRCYFRQLRRELHLERATVQTSTSDAQDTDEENNKAEEDEAGRVTSEMLEDGSYQQENVRYVLETFGAVWQHPEALRSPHVIAPDGKTEGDVARMSAETMGLPPRLCATQLLFQ